MPISHPIKSLQQHKGLVALLLLIAGISALSFYLLWQQTQQIQYLKVLTRSAQNQQHLHQRLVDVGAKELQRSDTSITYLIDYAIRNHPLVKQLKLQRARYKPVAEIDSWEYVSDQPLRLLKELPQQAQIYQTQALEVVQRTYTVVMGTFSQANLANQEKQRLSSLIPELVISINRNQRQNGEFYWRLYSQAMASRIQKDRLVERLRRYGVDPFVLSRTAE